MRVCQKHSYGFRVAVHHRFFTRSVLDAQHADTLVLKFDLVMPRINLHWVIGYWLGYSCGCHISSLDLVRWASVVPGWLKVHSISRPPGRSAGNPPKVMSYGISTLRTLLFGAGQRSMSANAFHP